MVIVCVLINVAFFTLLERKILGLSQFRKGPNKVGIIGMLQPFSDAIKLFINQTLKLEKFNILFFFFSPFFILLLRLVGWSLIPQNYLQFEYSLLLLLVILGIGLYPLLLSRWSRNSSYAIIGGLRGVAQTISYEISLALILIRLITFIIRTDLKEIEQFARFPLLLISFPLIVIWLIRAIAETNRTPFDFVEGERELVSGFNIEYGRGNFALIFIAEYRRILLLRAFSVLFFFNTKIAKEFFFGGVILVGFFWVWIRCTLPRFRYDKLINFTWKGILPFILVIIISLFLLN